MNTALALRQGQVRDIGLLLAQLPAPVTDAEAAVLARLAGRSQVKPGRHDRAALKRFLAPMDEIARHFPPKGAPPARAAVIRGLHRQQVGYWAWSEETFAEVALDASCSHGKFQVVALGYLVAGHRRLHHKARLQFPRRLAEFVFGPGAIEPAVETVLASLRRWEAIPPGKEAYPVNAAIDMLLSCGSPHLADITAKELDQVLAECRADGPASRIRGLFPLSRVLADQGIIAGSLRPNAHHAGYRPEGLATVPDEWLSWVERWRKLTLHEPGTVSRAVRLLHVAGRWVAEKHPEHIAPDQWTRDMAAGYVADTAEALSGSWVGVQTNTTHFGQKLSAWGRANRISAVRGFFNDLIEWEWITPKFDPRRVFAVPLKVNAQIGPNPRVVDDATWAKLMAPGLTLNAEDLDLHGTPSARATGGGEPFYPVEMVRALVGVWLFAGCRVDEIRRLELDCIVWDTGHDAHTGEPFDVCLLRVPANKTSQPFTKPVDPVVGQLIEAWKLIRRPQPDHPDRKTGQRRQHLFCHRGRLMGANFLNTRIIPALCRKAGVPEHDSRGAMTSHRARATIATQLLNAREPLSLNDLQQWLGHKHPASTRHYAAILQRTLSAAYQRADYFARNVRTIQVLVDRESILTGTAAGGEQPWKYYDLGEGYCSYDFFAKCPHRLACARCPFYVPKRSSHGQLLAVKDGITQMLEQLDLTEDEREALGGDLEAVTALAQRLADIPTPAGPTPRELGTTEGFIPLTQLTSTIRPIDQADNGN